MYQANFNPNRKPPEDSGIGAIFWLAVAWAIIIILCVGCSLLTLQWMAVQQNF